ncbi:MAG TPA: sugar phosphate isomerase/epimerase [Terriglobia bacterium]|nr:sugar phosphate isomerase/epimerase [Terriglobia bacterium]
MSPINRRKFLQKGAAGLAALPALGMLSCQTETPPAPVQEATKEAGTAPPLGLPIGLELYTVRNECEKDFEGTLAKVAAIGYKEVEVYDFYGKTAADVRKLLDANGLTSPSGHLLMAKLKSGLAKHIEDAKTLGMEYLICPILDPKDRDSMDDFKRHAEFFNKLGEQCKKAGIQFGYHNHDFEFKSYDGVIPYDELLRLTDPDLVKMELDCYWMTRAGKDPVEYLTKNPGRFPLLHIKDAMKDAPTSTDLDEGRGYFTEVGRGTIDWVRIFKAAPQGSVKHYYVEQDMCDGSPLDSIKISYDYLKDLRV